MSDLCYKWVLVLSATMFMCAGYNTSAEAQENPFQVNSVSRSPKISFLISKNTKINLDFDYTLDDFTATIEAHDGTVLRLREFATGLSLEHEFRKNLSASIGAGGEFNRMTEYQTDTGKADLKNGLYMMFKVNAYF